MSLYLLRSWVNRPEHINDDEWAILAKEELEYGIEMRREGKLVDIWRVAGEYAAVSIWAAVDNDELHSLISGLPMFAFAKFEVTALATHSSTRRWREMCAEQGFRENA